MTWEWKLLCRLLMWPFEGGEEMGLERMQNNGGVDLIGAQIGWAQARTKKHKCNQARAKLVLCGSAKSACRS